MDKNLIINSYRIITALLILAAVTTQLLTNRQTPVNFFSYFTVLSNLLVSVVYIATVFNLLDKNTLNKARGAATLYIVITGLGFSILLGGNNSEFLVWTNTLLHFIVPMVVSIDWLVTPSAKISYKESLGWIVLLVLYLAYSMIRGYATSWYPYGFLDPKEVGGAGIFTYVGIITASSLLISWVITKLSGRCFSAK
jgi:hypothetical protein